MTSPGSSQQSQNFSLEFVSEHQNGREIGRNEYETDWQEGMKTILNCLEMFPSSVDQLEYNLNSSLETWIAIISTGWTRVQAKMEENMTRNTSRGDRKNLTISIQDKFRTELHFRVTKS